MSAIPVEIISRTPNTGNAAKQFPRRQEPAGIVVTQIDALTKGNERGCGDDNPYN
ncbi:hypothetical protein ACTOB_001117 [Actinoplanes oblitus]|uniref:Uncharacterized protein n=1 Tax=Actinoplanes oblitus TaxID=3040509 RepID=A0ABY8WI72_9ACTN|nr:hypothetical protein [Actinoplanes oblitus]WIM97584.1 hypothetical protein ACTOB_001117 [Actinoplanes oblitus]